MPRLFVAIDFPPEIKLSLWRLCVGLPGARWVAPGNFHLTLRFIGEVDDPTTAGIAAALEQVEAPRFWLTPAGVGHFGETIARRTYQAFCHHASTTPRSILAAGWDFLVNPVMPERGYVRYDQIRRDCQKLVVEYDGSLWQLHEMARDASDRETRLLACDGVGPVTANIFLRELRLFWPKADPSPLPVVTAAARSLGLDLSRFRRKTLTFVRIEAGLMRMRRQYRHETAQPTGQADPR